MSITRSKMKEVLSTVTNESTVVEVLLLVLDQFGKWEEEGKSEEWPRLTPTTGFRGWVFVAQRSNGSRLVLSEEEADKIARVWEARRPGGEMEKRILAVATAIDNNGFTASAEVLRVALKLGLRDDDNG